MKSYAIKLTVKPVSNGRIKYIAKTYKGIVIANNPGAAKDGAIALVLKSFQKNDGSELKPKIQRENITIKECKLYNDFIFNTNDKH